MAFTIFKDPIAPLEERYKAIWKSRISYEDFLEKYKNTRPWSYYAVEKNNPGDLLLCECEMVPQAVVDDLVHTLERHGGVPGLQAIGRRSRIGKGPCQGTFCSQRVAAYLYDRGLWQDNRGIDELRLFLRERWRGQAPLLWDISLAQAELLEATHCGVFGLELDPTSIP